MKTAFEALMTGLDEVEAFLAGERKGFKVHVPDRMADRQSNHGGATPDADRYRQ